MFLRRFRIAERSMAPAIMPGDYVVVDTLRYRIRDPKPGEIVVFMHGGMEMVKRIKRREEDGYFVLGDNSLESSDSRAFGPVARADIIGKVVWIAK